MDTQSRSLFISSCTRRQLARRRAGRVGLRVQLMAAAVLVVAAGTFIVLRGGL